MQILSLLSRSAWKHFFRRVRQTGAHWRRASPQFRWNNFQLEFGFTEFRIGSSYLKPAWILTAAAGQNRNCRIYIYICDLYSLPWSSHIRSLFQEHSRVSELFQRLVETQAVDTLTAFDSYCVTTDIWWNSQNGAEVDLTNWVEAVICSLSNHQPVCWLSDLMYPPSG